MVEDVLDAQEFERQDKQENIVGRITTLNDMKSTPQIDPPRVQKFPKQRTRVLAEIAEGTVSFFEHWVPVDMNPVDDFTPLLVALAPGTQYGHLVPVLVQ